MKDELRFRYARVILPLVVVASIAVLFISSLIKDNNQIRATNDARATAVQRVTDDASKRMREALSANIAARALALSATDNDIALLIAIEALNVLKRGDTLPHAAEHAIWQTLTNGTVQNVAGSGQSTPVNTGQLISPDGHWLVVFDEQKRVAELRDLTAVEPDTSISLFQQSGAITAVAFSPDSRWLAIGSRDKTAVLYDLELADPADNVNRLEGHTQPITALAFSPDGRWLVTASEDKTLRLYPMTHSNFEANEIVLQRVEATDDIPAQKGHGDTVTAVAFKHDSAWLASAGKDKVVFLWSLSDDPQAYPIQLDAPDGVIHSLLFSSEGRWLTAVNTNNQSAIWSLDAQELKTRACTQVKRNLTQAEWGTHLPELHYNKTCQD